MTSGNGNRNGSGPSGSGSGFFQQQQPKRRPPPAPGGPSSSFEQQQRAKLLRLSTAPQAAGQDDVAPPVTVVLGEHCICPRVHLGRHSGYRSLAAALRRMFVDQEEDDGNNGATAADDADGQGGLVDLSNAVPGHVVAYEDMEDDLLLAGDLNWRDFVRVAKRIRIIPAKSPNKRTATTTKQCGGGAAR